MTEYSRMAKGTFTSTGASKYINLPFQPDYVEFLNTTINAIPRANGVISATWDANDGQGTAEVDIYNAGGVYVTDSVLTNGISTFAAGLSLQYGPPQQIVSTATDGGNTVFTVTGHGYTLGDVVVLYGLYETPTTGMPQLAGIPFSIFAVTANTFEIDWNTTGSNYTQLSGSPVGAMVKKVLYPFLYEPGELVVTATAPGPIPGTTNILTSIPHNYVVGQEVAFRIPRVWGPYQLNSLPNNVIPGSPVYYYVTAIQSNLVFTINVASASITPFNVNQPVSSVPGLTFPQVVAVGDINSGGWPYTGAALYPSPMVNGVPTINGPPIMGAFINNTSQGFIIGSGRGATDALSILVGNSGDIIRWRAFLHDYSSP